MIGGLGKAAKTLSLPQSSSLSASNLEAIVVLCYAVVSAAEKEKPALVMGKKNKGEVVEWSHLKITAAEGIKAIASAPTLPKFYQTFTDLEHLVG